MSRLTMMRGIRFLIPTLLFLSFLSTINPVLGAEQTAYLYVDGYNEWQYDDGWMKGGTSPYLNDTAYPTTYLNCSESYGNINNAPPYDYIGNFTFEDIDHVNKTLVKVEVQVFVRSMGTYTPEIFPYLYESTSAVWFTPTDGSWEWKWSYYMGWFQWSDLVLCTGVAPPAVTIDTWAEINATELRLACLDPYPTHSADDILIIDRARLVITYLETEWQDVCTWYGILGSLQWNDVCIWYGILRSSLYYFEICDYLLFFMLGDFVMVAFTTAHGAKNKNPHSFITAIVLFGIGFALMVTFGGMC